MDTYRRSLTELPLVSSPGLSTSVTKLSDQITQQPLQELRFIVTNDGIVLC